jgi:hypothetical protein
MPTSTTGRLPSAAVIAASGEPGVRTGWIVSVIIRFYPAGLSYASARPFPHVQSGRVAGRTASQAVLASWGRTCWMTSYASCAARSLEMPSLFRFLTVVAIIVGVAYGAIFALANFVNPKPREMTVTIPPDKFLKK